MEKEETEETGRRQLSRKKIISIYGLLQHYMSLNYTTMVSALFKANPPSLHLLPK